MFDRLGACIQVPSIDDPAVINHQTFTGRSGGYPASFQCIACGACASKCPAEISQPNVALLARRIYGRHMLVIPDGVYQRISDIEKGKYTGVLEQLVQMDQEQLTHTYTLREQEPQDNRGWTPKHPTFPEDPPADG